MKKFRILLIVMVGIVVGCGVLEFILPITDYGTSTLYSQEEIEDAIQIVRDEFNLSEGCKLYSISYTSDYTSRKELTHCNELNKSDIPYTECIVLETKFRSPMFGGGAWNANRIYDWTWHLARTRNGNWEIIDRGVC